MSSMMSEVDVKVEGNNGNETNNTTIKLEDGDQNSNDFVFVQPQQVALKKPEETFVPAESLFSAQDSADWDMLVTRGTGSEGISKWERESLYRKFDPMLEKTKTSSSPVSNSLREIANDQNNKTFTSIEPLEEEVELNIQMNPQQPCNNVDTLEKTRVQQLSESFKLISINTPSPRKVSTHCISSANRINLNEDLSGLCEPLTKSPVPATMSPSILNGNSSFSEEMNETEVIIKSEELMEEEQNLSYTKQEFTDPLDEQETQKILEDTEEELSASFALQCDTGENLDQITMQPQDFSLDSPLTNVSTKNPEISPIAALELDTDLTGLGVPLRKSPVLASMSPHWLNGSKISFSDEIDESGTFIANKETEETEQDFTDANQLDDVPTDEQETVRFNEESKLEHGITMDTTFDRGEKLENTSTVQELELDPFKLISINTPSPKKTFSKVPETETQGLDSDLSGFGLPLKEARVRATMSPSLLNGKSPSSEQINGPDTLEKLDQDISGKEQQFQTQIAEKEERIRQLENANVELEKKVGAQCDTGRVLLEYEKTMAAYIQQIESLKRQLVESDEEKMGIIQERDQAMEDLRNVEKAFSDVHRKYERAKSTLDNFKKNEDVLKLRDQELLKSIEMRDKKMEVLKQQAQSSLESMHHDYESKLQQSESENTKLKALLRKTEMKINTLESDLEQKHKENVKLNELCDDLINGGVGKS